MSAVETVRKNRESLVPEPGIDRETLARQLFYMQMEIYSAHAGRDLYDHDSYEYLPEENKKGFLEMADDKLAEQKDG